MNFSLILAKRIVISPEKLGELAKGWVPIRKIEFKNRKPKNRLPAIEAALNLFITVHLQITS